jgi:flagellar P-ring protein precursor FlgI
VVPTTTINVEEGEGQNLVVLRAGVSLGELVNGLNALGATPQDLIAILEAIGRRALSADLELM